MAQNKTVPTTASVDGYLAQLQDAEQRADCQALAALMSKVSNWPAQMWGSSIIGFGSYHYRYASGHEGDSCVFGFAARKKEISLYGLKRPQSESLLARLGKYKEGKSCLYIRRLQDVDLAVLEELIRIAQQDGAGPAC